MWASVYGLLYLVVNGVLHETGSVSKSNAKEASTLLDVIQSCVAANAGRVVTVKIKKMLNNFFIVSVV